MNKIFQIWITDKGEPPNEYIIQQMSKLKKMYSNCEYHVYDNDKIVQFLSSFFDKRVLIAYQKCKPYAFKSDLIRYCLLYVYGGYYFDVSICPEFKLENQHEAYILKGESIEIDSHRYDMLDNGVMFFKNINNEFLKSAIDKCVNNILMNNYGKSAFDITGPMMLNSINHEKIHKYPYCIIDNEKVVLVDKKLWVKYPNGFSSSGPPKYKNINVSSFGKNGTNNYYKMWHDKDVFHGSRDDVLVRDSIIKLYNEHLNRFPDIDGLNNYLNCGLTIDEIKKDILNSKEYRNIKH